MEGILLRNVHISNSNGLCNGFGKDLKRSGISKVFMNNDHKRYYGGKNLKIRGNNATVIVEKSEKIVMNDVLDKKMVKKKKMMMKKRSKLLKGLSKDILAVLGLGHNGLQFQEASEVLLSQLKQLKSEEQELKKKMKEEKANKKAAVDSSSSSSSSSESSDSECEREVLDMSRLKRETGAVPPLAIRVDEEDLRLPENEGQTTAPSPSLAAIVQEKYTVPKTEQDCSNSLIRLLEDPKEEEKNTKKLEVCMGGKCKKSGAGVLLEEFQRVLGETDPAVEAVGCKCMGKCRDGPNVRLVSSSLAPPPIDAYDEPHHHEYNQVPVATAAVAVTDSSSILTRSRKRMSRPSHPLCMGVGLDDVGFIVSKLVEDR